MSFPSSNTPFQKISVLGHGLIGGSVALAASRAFCDSETTLWGRDSTKISTIQELIERHQVQFQSKSGKIVTTTDMIEAVRDANLIILAMPVQHMKFTVDQLFAAGLTPDQLVTDVGSVKQFVHQELDTVFAENHGSFIGSHPMAGGEQTGFEAASASLFENAACIVTNEGTGTREQRDLLCQFWKQLGCRVYEMSACEHDAAVARVSHLPHIASSACASVSLKDHEGHLAGGGLRDLTRLASGDAAMWRGIVEENSHSVSHALEEMITALSEYKAQIDSGNFDELEKNLASAKKLRDTEIGTSTRSS